MQISARHRRIIPSSEFFSQHPMANSHTLPHLHRIRIPTPTVMMQCKQQEQNESEARVSSVFEMLNSVPQWVDDIKEGRMRKPKSLYTHREWVIHRSSTRHIRHLASSLSSRVILSLIPPVCIFTALAVAIAAYNTAVVCDLFPPFMPLLHASSLPYQLTAPALALLLVFRTEASYSRYDEGRKAWTNVISGAKDFARQAVTWIRVSDDAHLKDKLLQYIMAFPVVLKCHITHGSDMRHDLGTLLQEDDLQTVFSSQHPPSCILQLMSECLERVQLVDSKQNILDSHICQFNDSISVCERLIGIPIPLSYTRLTSRFLVLWHLTLPIILWDECEWIVVPATFVSAASLFCIEEVGVLIEEPFPMLALQQMCTLAHENIRDMINLHNSIDDNMNTEKKILSYRVGSNGTGWRNRGK